MFSAYRAWRRRRILRKYPLDPTLWQQVSSRFGFVARLDDKEKSRLRDLCVLFLREKQISAASGLKLDDEMLLGIAIQACILILNLGIDCYNGWVEIIVYPDEFVPRHQVHNEHGVVETDETAYSGQAWLRGPVILSWVDVEYAWIGDGANVVIHEFAHKLDMLNGEANGFPPLHPGMDRRIWAEVFTAAYEDFCRRVDARENTEIDPYASEAPAEFFAVLSENFFEMPDLVREVYPQVYDQLAAFYRMDLADRELPREWRLRRV